MAAILSILMAILGPILRAVFPTVLDAANQPDTAEEARRRPELRERLRRRVRDSWAPVVALLLLGPWVTLSGCVRVRTVYIPPGEPVRLAESVPDVTIWTVDADGEPVKGRVDLPEGWYCLPDPGPE